MSKVPTAPKAPRTRSLNETFASSETYPWQISDRMTVLVGKITILHYLSYKQTFGSSIDTVLKTLDRLEGDEGDGLEGMDEVLPFICWLLSLRGRIVGPLSGDGKRFELKADGTYDLKPVTWEEVADNIDLTSLMTLDAGKFGNLMKDLGLLADEVRNEEERKGEVRIPA